MKAFIGCKIILAEPAERDGEPGYTVVYADHYKSWSPKEVFEEAYRPISESEADIVKGVLGSRAPDTFFTRLLAEEKELGERLDKLDAFIISDAFRAVDFDQRKLLQHQALVMNNYRDLLQKRIALATKVLDTPAQSEEIGEVKITGGGSVEDPIPFKN